MTITDSKTVILSEAEIKKILVNEVASRLGCQVDIKNIRFDVSSDGPYERQKLRSASILCEVTKKEEEI